MANSFNPIVIFVIIIAVVVLINVGLFTKLKQNTKNSKGSAMNSLINTVRSPWKDEDAALDELANLVRLARDEENNENDVD